MNVVGQDWYKKLHDSEFWKINSLVKLPQKTEPIQPTYSYNQRRNDYVI